MKGRAAISPGLGPASTREGHAKNNALYMGGLPALPKRLFSGKGERALAYAEFGGSANGSPTAVIPERRSLIRDRERLPLCDPGSRFAWPG